MDGEKMHNVLSPAPENDNVVYGHKICQTRDAKWLCIGDLYQKFHRPNFFDIGGTYIVDVADYWFTYKTEKVGTIFLLHLFITNRNSGSFNVSLSYNSDFIVDRKNKLVSLSTSLTEYQIKDPKEGSQNYLCTYSFTDLEVSLIKDRKFYIAVSFHTAAGKIMNQQIIEDIKANHDFRALLTDPIGADFTMESADGEKFQTHKVLLSVHSEVFKAMLKEDTAESQNNYVKLVNVTTEDLRHILEFIYTGTIADIDNCNSLTLLELADLYNIKGLRELAQYILSEQLSVENAVEILMVSEMYNSEQLKLKALRFIKQHPSALKANSFNEINNPALVRELCAFIAL